MVFKLLALGFSLHLNYIQLTSTISSNLSTVIENTGVNFIILIEITKLRSLNRKYYIKHIPS